MGRSFGRSFGRRLGSAVGLRARFRLLRLHLATALAMSVICVGVAIDARSAAPRSEPIGINARVVFNPSLERECAWCSVGLAFLLHQITLGNHFVGEGNHVVGVAHSEQDDEENSRRFDEHGRGLVCRARERS